MDFDFYITAAEVAAGTYIVIEHAVNNQTCCCRQRDMETPRDEAECTQNIQLLTVYTLLSQSQFGIMILQLALIANCLPRLIQHNDKLGNMQQ